MVVASSHLRSLGKTSVLVAGSAVIDFVFTVDDMPRAAEKYRARDAAFYGGGCAANAAVAVARLGGAPILVAPLGDDEAGDMIVRGLERDGVDCSAINRIAGRRSSVSSVFIDRRGERQIVNYRDPALEHDLSWLTGLEAKRFDAALADSHLPAAAAEIMRAARERGVPGVLDGEVPTRGAREAISLASHIGFSAQGLADLSGETDIEKGLRAARAIASGFVCVTDGANGTYHLSGDAFVHTPAFAVDAVDTLGAGDVWHGAFALALGEGMNEPEAIRFASAVAAIKCSRKGGRAGYPRRADLTDFLKEAMQ